MNNWKLDDIKQNSHRIIKYYTKDNKDNSIEFLELYKFKHLFGKEYLIKYTKLVPADGNHVNDNNIFTLYFTEDSITGLYSFKKINKKFKLMPEKYINNIFDLYE